MTNDTFGIVHALAPAPYGGLERVVRALALGQADRGHRVAVCAVVAPGSKDHPFLADFEGSAVTPVPVAAGRLDLRSERAAVHGTVRSSGARLLHTHGYRTDVVDGWTAARRDLPVVSTVHGFTRGGGKNRVYEILQRRALRRFDGVVAVSRPLADELVGSGVSEARVWTIPNGWVRSGDPLPRPRARRALGVATDDPFLVGWVGRLSAEKGPDVLIEALSALQGEGLAVAMVGDGPERPALEERARVLGVDGMIRWAGAVPEAASLFPAFDAFVLSSRTEGTPIVLFEAMDAGVPVVATAVGGVPDVVGESEALLVPPDDPVSLAGAIRALRRDRVSAGERARRARRRLEGRFSYEAWLDRYDECYRSILGPGGPRPGRGSGAKPGSTAPSGPAGR